MCGDHGPCNPDSSAEMTKPRLKCTCVLLASLLMSGQLAAHLDLLLQIDSLTRQIELDRGSNPELYLKRGDLYRRHGEWESASLDFHEVRSLDPDHATIDWFEGRMMVEAGQWLDGKTLLSRFLAVHPSHAGAHRYRAAAWWKLGDPAASAGDYEKAISNSERPSPSLYRSLVITQFASGADYYPAAVTTVDAALQRFPVEVSLLGLAVDLALERSDTGAATVYISRLPTRLAGLNQWQFRAALLACLEGQVDMAQSTFAKLASDAQGTVRHRSGTWNVSVEILSGLAQRPEPESCRSTVRDFLSMLQP